MTSLIFEKLRLVFLPTFTGLVFTIETITPFFFSVHEVYETFAYTARKKITLDKTVCSSYNYVNRRVMDINIHHIRSIIFYQTISSLSRRILRFFWQFLKKLYIAKTTVA